MSEFSVGMAENLSTWLSGGAALPVATTVAEPEPGAKQKSRPSLSEVFWRAAGLALAGAAGVKTKDIVPETETWFDAFLSSLEVSSDG